MQCTTTNKWIPVKTCKPTEEDYEYAYRVYHYTREDLEWVFDSSCKLPENGQEVLVTTFNKDVVITTYRDDSDGCYFEGYESEGDIIAWMPSPEPYGGEE